MDCLFCKIINKEIPSEIIYEDSKVIIFLDIKPSTNGDMLIIPKDHYENITDMPLEEITYIYKIIKDKYETWKNKLNFEGLTIAQNNEYGQEIKHFHIHLTPRYFNDKHEHTFNKEIIKNLKDIQKQLTE